MELSEINITHGYVQESFSEITQLKSQSPSHHMQHIATATHNSQIKIFVICLIWDETLMFERLFHSPKTVIWLIKQIKNEFGRA